MKIPYDPTSNTIVPSWIFLFYEFHHCNNPLKTGIIDIGVFKNCINQVSTGKFIIDSVNEFTSVHFENKN